MLPAELAAIDHHKDAKTLCNHLIDQCQTFNDISAFVQITLILERTPPGTTLTDPIDNYPDAPAIRQAMRDHLFCEWQTATRIRMTRAVCEEAIRELEQRFAIAGIRGPLGAFNPTRA